MLELQINCFQLFCNLNLVTELYIIQPLYYPTFSSKFRYKVANNTRMKRDRAFIVYHAANQHACRSHAVLGNA